MARILAQAAYSGAQRKIADAHAKLTRSPVVEVKRAAAVGFASGADAGLELLEPLLEDPALESYQPPHAAHGELLRHAGDAAGAGRA